jgi:hypothetical protein
MLVCKFLFYDIVIVVWTLAASNPKQRFNTEGEPVAPESEESNFLILHGGTSKPLFSDQTGYAFNIILLLQLLLL